jgi:hypothetical protein
MNIGYSIDKALIAMGMENIQEAATEAANMLVENKEDLSLIFQQADMLEKSKAANKSTKPCPKPKSAKVKETKAALKIWSTEDLKKELDNTLSRHPLLKEQALRTLHGEVERLGPDATREEILACVTSAYGPGHEAEAEYAFDFLLTTTDGKLKKAVAEAKKLFIDGDPEKDIPGHSQKIAQAKALESVALKVQKESGGEPSALYNQFSDLVAKQPESIALYKQLKKEYPNPAERAQMIASFYRSIGTEVRTIAVDDSKQLAASTRSRQ